MASPPPIEFGKRQPAPVSLAPAPVKRSRHVALLLMGTFAVGGSAFALMPRENCQPTGAGVAAPSSPQTATACASRSSSWSGGHGGSGGSWSRSGFYGGDSASSSGASTVSGATETTRGGFGSFARAIGAHFSGS